MEQKKFRVNILDFLIIALVVLCIVGAVLRIYAKNSDVKLTGQTATVSFLIQDIQSESKDAFKSGDRIYSEELECELGKLLGNVVATDAVYYDSSDNAEIVKSYSNGLRVDVRGKFICKGTMTESSGFAVNGTQYIAPNMSISVSFPNIKAIILITDVEVH